MTDLRDRAPARSAMQKLVSYRGTPEIRELWFGMVHIQPEALMWLRGVRGELFMARQLRKLDDRWVVLHSVPVGDRGSDIDHLVVGPTGVFPINTKRLIGGEVVVIDNVFRNKGWKHPYLRNSAFEAKRVDGILSRARIATPVLPIIAISGAKSIKTKQPNWEGRQVGVAKVENVVSRLQRRPTRLTDDQVRHIVEVISDSTQWTRRAPEPVVEAEQRRLEAAYRKIDQGVGRYRRAWMLVGLVIASSGLVLAGWLFTLVVW